METDFDTLTEIARWHLGARNSPTPQDFNVQLGCHFEEILEMLQTLTFANEYFEALPGTKLSVYNDLKFLSDGLKLGVIKANIVDRKELLDSLADQIVTGTGVGHCAGMNVPAAAQAVNWSNWSKFDDGTPLRDMHGKIIKGPNYTPPDLEGLY